MFPRLVFPKYYCLSRGDASALNHLGFQFVFEFCQNSKIKRRGMGIKVTAFNHLAFCTFPLAKFITLASRIFQLATFMYLTFCILLSTAFINLAFHIFLLGTFTHLVQPILHGPSMVAVKAKIYAVLYNPAGLIDFDETSSYWSAPNSS